jgi:hypothetical protein
MSEIILPVKYRVDGDNVSFSAERTVGNCSNRKDPVTLADIEDNEDDHNKLGFVFTKSNSSGKQLFDCYQDSERLSNTYARQLIKAGKNPTTRQPFTNANTALRQLEEVTLVFADGKEVVVRIPTKDSIFFTDFNYLLASAVEVRTSSDDGMITLPDYLFQNAASLKRAILGEGLQAIGDSTFTGAKLLEFVQFPQSLKYIKPWAFSGCTSLTRIVFPPQLSELGWFSFKECTALQSVVFGGDIDNINHGTFEMCTSLESVEFQGSVSRIGEKAFSNCPNLRRVVVTAGTRISDTAFDAGVVIVRRSRREREEDEDVQAPPRQQRAGAAVNNWMQPGAHLKRRVDHLIAS